MFFHQLYEKVKKCTINLIVESPNSAVLHCPHPPASSANMFSMDLRCHIPSCPPAELRMQRHTYTSIQGCISKRQTQDDVKLELALNVSPHLKRPFSDCFFVSTSLCRRRPPSRNSKLILVRDRKAFSVQRSKPRRWWLEARTTCLATFATRNVWTGIIELTT